jgi:type III pantothenate kinase
MNSGKYAMLLAFDIGNTTVAFGLFRGRDLIKDWKIASDKEKTSDEYEAVLQTLFRFGGLDPKDIDGVIISSVVPPLTPVFQEIGKNVFGCRALVVGPGLKTGMPILYEAPLEVGADRITASIAAYEKYGGPCIILDFGTATTFDVVSGRGEYLGGAIAPGIRIAAEALYLKTARLPRIEIRKPRRAIGRTTVASMQSGLYHGYVGLVTHTIAEIRKELGSEAKVVCTGGFGGEIVGEIRDIDAHDPHLVLEGLRIVYERNRTAGPGNGNDDPSG